ncbi:hypothetical protein Tco_0602205 [Tanacetum coccineum]
MRILPGSQPLFAASKSYVYSGHLKVLELSTVSPILVSVRCQKPGHLAARLGCAETKVATWDDLAFKLIILRWNVRILQKSQENGQNRTNTDTGMEKSAQEPGECYQDQQKSNLGQPKSKDKNPKFPNSVPQS